MEGIHICATVRSNSKNCQNSISSYNRERIIKIWCALLLLFITFGYSDAVGVGRLAKKNYFCSYD